VRVLFAPVGADPRRTLYVDGTAEGYRSLSHWPGNGTPRSLKRDTSTGIALAFAACEPADRLALVGSFDQVANNHYDTDGVLSVYSVVAPESALGQADLLLRAAMTGDFGVWQGPDALALDLALGLCGLHPGVGPTLPAGTSAAGRHAAAYVWAATGLPDLIASLGSASAPWAPRQRALEAELLAVERGEGLQVEQLPGFDLAVVVCQRPLSRLALSAAAGPCSRVLLISESPDGNRYRFVQRVESWFEIVSRAVPPRRDLAPVTAALGEAERVARSRAGLPAGSWGWWAGTPDEPVCQLGYGDASQAGDGFSSDTDLRADPGSRLSRETVLELLEPALRPD